MPAIVFALAAARAGAPPPASNQAPAKAPATAAAPKSPSTTAPPAKKSAAPAKKSSAAPRKGSRKRSTAARSSPSQAAPTPDRIREIQQALAGRGYETPVNGTWGKESEAALAKFQTDQNLDGKGKLNSLSIIALGLGPKHDSNPEPATPPAQKD